MLLDHHAVRDAAEVGLHLKLEPTYLNAVVPAELPTVATIGAQWDGYLQGQDLSGLDRDRVQRLGHEYLDEAVIGSDTSA